jgi:hypothetical protein
MIVRSGLALLIAALLYATATSAIALIALKSVED